MTSTVTEKKEEPEVEVLEPSVIVSEAYKSLDKQIEKLERIPEEARKKGAALVALVYDSSKKILQDPKATLEFINTVQELEEESGNAFDAVLEVEREQARNSKDPDLPSLPEIPKLPIQTESQQSATPVVVNQTPQPVQKRGFFASMFEHLSNRKWADAYKYAVDAQNRRPEITTSKVINILDYGRQLESEFSRLKTFFNLGRKRVYFYDDPGTIRNQMSEIQLECEKIAGIIRVFNKAMTEYRKDRFGDRKVGVAAGAMWLQAMQSQQQSPNQVNKDSLHKLWGPQ